MQSNQKFKFYQTPCLNACELIESTFLNESRSNIVQHPATSSPSTCFDKHIPYAIPPTPNPYVCGSCDEESVLVENSVPESFYVNRLKELLEADIYESTHEVFDYRLLPPTPGRYLEYDDDDDNNSQGSNAIFSICEHSFADSISSCSEQDSIHECASREDNEMRVYPDFMANNSLFLEDDSASNNSLSAVEQVTDLAVKNGSCNLTGHIQNLLSFKKSISKCLDAEKCTLATLLTSASSMCNITSVLQDVNLGNLFMLFYNATIDNYTVELKCTLSQCTYISVVQPKEKLAGHMLLNNLDILAPTFQNTNSSTIVIGHYLELCNYSLISLQDTFAINIPSEIRNSKQLHSTTNINTSRWSPSHHSIKIKDLYVNLYDMADSNSKSYKQASEQSRCSDITLLATKFNMSSCASNNKSSENKQSTIAKDVLSKKSLKRFKIPKLSPCCKKQCNRNYYINFRKNAMGCKKSNVYFPTNKIVNRPVNVHKTAKSTPLALFPFKTAADRSKETRLNDVSLVQAYFCQNTENNSPTVPVKKSLERSIANTGENTHRPAQSQWAKKKSKKIFDCKLDNKTQTSSENDAISMKDASVPAVEMGCDSLHSHFHSISKPAQISKDAKVPTVGSTSVNQITEVKERFCVPIDENTQMVINNECTSLLDTNHYTPTMSSVRYAAQDVEENNKTVIPNQVHKTKISLSQYINRSKHVLIGKEDNIGIGPTNSTDTSRKVAAEANDIVCSSRRNAILDKLLSKYNFPCLRSSGDTKPKVHKITSNIKMDQYHRPWYKPVPFERGLCAFCFGNDEESPAISFSETKLLSKEGETLDPRLRYSFYADIIQEIKEKEVQQLNTIFRIIDDTEPDSDAEKNCEKCKFSEQKIDTAYPLKNAKEAATTTNADHIKQRDYNAGLFNKKKDSANLVALKEMAATYGIHIENGINASQNLHCVRSVAKNDNTYNSQTTSIEPSKSINTKTPNNIVQYFANRSININTRIPKGCAHVNHTTSSSPSLYNASSKTTNSLTFKCDDMHSYANVSMKAVAELPIAAENCSTHRTSNATNATVTPFVNDNIHVRCVHRSESSRYSHDKKDYSHSIHANGLLVDNCESSLLGIDRKSDEYLSSFNIEANNNNIMNYMICDNGNNNTNKIDNGAPIDHTNLTMKRFSTTMNSCSNTHTLDSNSSNGEKNTIENISVQTNETDKADSQRSSYTSRLLHTCNSTYTKICKPSYKNIKRLWSHMSTVKNVQPDHGISKPFMLRNPNLTLLTNTELNELLTVNDLHVLFHPQMFQRIVKDHVEARVYHYNFMDRFYGELPSTTKNVYTMVNKAIRWNKLHCDENFMKMLDRNIVRLWEDDPLSAASTRVTSYLPTLIGVLIYLQHSMPQNSRYADTLAEISRLLHVAECTSLKDPNDKMNVADDTSYVNRLVGKHDFLPNSVTLHRWENNEKGVKLTCRNMLPVQEDMTVSSTSNMGSMMQSSKKDEIFSTAKDEMLQVENSKTKNSFKSFVEESSICHLPISRDNSVHGVIPIVVNKHKDTNVLPIINNSKSITVSPVAAYSVNRRQTIGDENRHKGSSGRKSSCSSSTGSSPRRNRSRHSAIPRKRQRSRSNVPPRRENNGNSVGASPSNGRDASTSRIYATTSSGRGSTTIRKRSRSRNTSSTRNRSRGYSTARLRNSSNRVARSPSYDIRYSSTSSIYGYRSRSRARDLTTRRKRSGSRTTSLRRKDNDTKIPSSKQNTSRISRSVSKSRLKSTVSRVSLSRRITRSRSKSSASASLFKSTGGISPKRKNSSRLLSPKRHGRSRDLSRSKTRSTNDSDEVELMPLQSRSRVPSPIQNAARNSDNLSITVFSPNTKVVSKEKCKRRMKKSDHKKRRKCHADNTVTIKSDTTDNNTNFIAKMNKNAAVPQEIDASNSAKESSSAHSYVYPNISQHARSRAEFHLVFGSTPSPFVPLLPLGLPVPIHY